MARLAAVSERVWIRRLSLVVGALLLVLAVGVLMAGYGWTLFAWSGGEYAEPPPTLGQKVGQALPWALGTLALVTILATVGVWLVLVWRRRGPARERAAGGDVLRSRPLGSSRGG